MKEQIVFLLKYNEDDDNQVISILEGLSQEERNADRKAYFKSLHGLFEHTVTTGLFFQKIIISAFPELKGLGSKYLDKKLEPHAINFPDFSDLKLVAQDIHSTYIKIANKLSEEELNRTITAATPRGTSEMKVWLLLLRYVNHSTHHKGQIMQILEEMGVDCNFGGLKANYD